MSGRLFARLSLLALAFVVLWAGASYKSGRASDGRAYVVHMGQTGVNAGQSFLSYNVKTVADTTGATADYWGSGFSPMTDATISGVWGNVSGATVGTVACTLRVFVTGVGAGTTEMTGEWAFSAPGTYAWPDTTFDVDADEVMTVWLGAASATLDYPSFYFHVVEDQ